MGFHCVMTGHYHQFDLKLLFTMFANYYCATTSFDKTAQNISTNICSPHNLHNFMTLFQGMKQENFMI